MHSIVRLRVKYINQFLHGYRKASLLSRDDEWVTRRQETKKMDRLHCRLVPVGPTFLIWPSTAYANRGTPTSMWRSPNEISYTVVVVECGNYMEACGAIATLFLNLKILVYCCFSTVNETQIGHIIETRSLKQIAKVSAMSFSGRKTRTANSAKDASSFLKIQFYFDYCQHHQPDKCVEWKQFGRQERHTRLVCNGDNIVADKFTHLRSQVVSRDNKGHQFAQHKAKRRRRKDSSLLMLYTDPSKPLFFVVVVFLTYVNCVVYQRAGVWRSNWRGETMIRRESTTLTKHWCPI